MDPNVDVRCAAKVPDEGGAFQPPDVPDPVVADVLLAVERQRAGIESTLGLEAGDYFVPVGLAIWINQFLKHPLQLLSLIGSKLGFPLPDGMCGRTLFLAGLVAALGLTVALFVCGAAFPDPELQGQAKMGALFSGFVGLAAILLGRLLKCRS